MGSRRKGAGLFDQGKIEKRMENSDKPICLKIWEMRPIRGTCRASKVLMSPIPAITSNSTLSDTFEVVLGASCPQAVDTQRGVELKAERLVVLFDSW